MSAQDTLVNAPSADSKPAFEPKWFDNTFLTIALMIFLWPIGVYALIKNRRLGGFGKFFIGGGITFCWVAVIGAAAFGGYYVYTHPEFVKQYYPLGGSNSPFASSGKNSNDSASPTLSASSASSDNGSVAREVSAFNAKAFDDAVAKQSGGGAVAIPQPPKDAVLTTPPDADPKPDPIVKKLPDPPKPDAPKNSGSIAREIAAANAKAFDEALARQSGGKGGSTPTQTGTNEAPLPPVATRDEPNGNAVPVPVEAQELQERASDLTERLNAAVAQKKFQIDGLKKTVGDYKTITALQPHIQRMDESFKSYLKERYKSESFDEARFNEFFTADYLVSYNAQLQKQQNGLIQYIKVLKAGSATSNEALVKVAREIDATNQKLIAAGKPLIRIPPSDPQLEKGIAELVATADTLPPRTITIADLRERILSKASSGKPDAVAVDITDPFAPKTPTPPKKTDPVVTRPRTNEPIARPPQTDPVPPPKTVEPTLPPATREITSADVQGSWIRGDGKAVWTFDAGGVLIAKSGRTRATGTWEYDEKSGTMTATHSGVKSTFAVTRDKDSLTMLGGAGATTTVRFNRVSKF